MYNFYSILRAIMLMILASSFYTVSNGQNTNLDDNGKCYYQWYINGSFGITQGHSDLQEGTWHLDMLNSNEMNYGYGVRLGKHINPVFTLYGSFVSAKLIGERKKRNLYFESELTDYIIGATCNFNNLFFGYKEKKRRLMLYGIAGFGFTSFRSKVLRISDNSFKGGYGYNIDGSESTKITANMVPTGIGLDFKISNRWDINLESAVRWFLDSDKLDGLKSGDQNDAFYFTSLGLSYNFVRPGEGGLKKMQREYERVKLLTTPSILELQGDSVVAVVKGTIPETYFHKKATVDFAPILVYDGGSIQLPAIVLKGEAAEGDGFLINSQTGGTFNYRASVPYDEKLNTCELLVTPIAHLGTKSLSLGERKLADGLILTSRRIAHDEEITRIPHGYTTGKTESESGTIYFLVNRHELNLNIQLNKDTEAVNKLKALDEFLEKGWTVKSVTINAWASPEGEESFNQGLSEKRAETGKEFINNKILDYLKELAKEKDIEPDELIQSVMYSAVSHGEDWDGFMKAVKKSDLADKGTIINVINSHANLTDREEAMRNMTLVYKDIEKVILPPLRRAEIEVTCIEPAKTDEEIARLATTEPKALEMKELLYAAILTEDPNARLNIYKSATEIFPNSWEAFNNAGYVCLEMGKDNEAKSFLERANSITPNKGPVLNNLGVIAAREGNYSKAKEYYVEAQKRGASTGYNNGIIKIYDGNYAGSKTSFGSKKCTYNVALSQLLNKEYDKAAKTLNCSPKEAGVYYLMAVVGARSGNESMIYENLKKAIKEDISFRDLAREDKEFVNYFNNPDFENALR